MARPRVIDQDAVLDCAEVVVARDGATGLTLEAVAQEAAISKASVLYDYKTKQALIRALVERRVKDHRARFEGFVDRFASDPDATIRGRIAAADEPMTEHSLAVSINICSALSQDSEIRHSMQDMVRDDIDRVLSSSSRPRSALLAFLAVQGFQSLEYLGLHRWSDDHRQQILREIAALIEIDLPATLKPVSPPN